MDVLRGLALIERFEAAGSSPVRALSATEARIRHGDHEHTARVRVLEAPPGPARVGRDLERLGADAPSLDTLVYVVPHVTRSLRSAALEDARLVVAGVDDETVILHRVERRISSTAGTGTTPARPRGRRPWGRLALLRVLLRTPFPRTQHDLAEEVGTTQQAIALALRQLGPERVVREDGGWRCSAPEAVWDTFLREYPGPDGVRRPWSGVADLGVQTERALAVAQRSGVAALLSGDAAADEQAPFRRPTSAVLYTTADLDLSGRFVPATADEVTLSVVVPADPTVFATASAWGGPEARSTDPVLTAWEVSRSRGSDRAEAVAALRDDVLEKWGTR